MGSAPSCGIAAKTCNADPVHDDRYGQNGRSPGEPKGVVKLVWLKVLLAVLLTIGLSNQTVASPSSDPEQIDVTVTAYTNARSSTNHTVTGSAVRLTKDHHWKLIALSPDLARRFKYGDEFELRVKGKVHHVVYQDTSSKSHKKKVDLLLPSMAACKKFGRAKGKLCPIPRKSAKNR